LGRCPEEFKARARELLLGMRGRPSGWDSTVQTDEGLRQAILKFIADFANWDNAAKTEYLETSRGLVQAAHPEETPLVVDPFAGGGSIPLEALRVGCETFASDLNPVACLILKVMLEDIPRHGPGLADELRKAGAEIKAKAEEELADLVEDALDFPIPLAPIEPGIHCLELFHGPTLAFKDVASRVMARLMARFVTVAGDTETTVIVATSGDTGSAVAHAFSGVAGFRGCVLYPAGLVTEAQRRLFTTLGGNVTAVAVEGTFDDCQSLAREAFADGELRRQRPLASANSINIGRLLPQVFYYFHAWAQLPAPPLDDAGEPLVFSTPSGNFGNLTAGLIAKRIGLPVSRFVAATNANDVVPGYLRSGDYLPRGSVATISNAMDVGNPSNFARIIHLYSGAGEPLEHIRRDLAGRAFDDQATRGAMRDVDDRTG